MLKKKHIEADTSKYLSPKEAGGVLKQPEFYKLNDGKSNQRIHHTRLIKFCHADVVNEEPVSVLQEVYEDLLDHAVKKASASLVHESKLT